MARGVAASPGRLQARDERKGRLISCATAGAPEHASRRASRVAGHGPRYAAEPQADRFSGAPRQGGLAQPGTPMQLPPLAALVALLPAAALAAPAPQEAPCGSCLTVHTTAMGTDMRMTLSDQVALGPALQSPETDIAVHVNPAVTHQTLLGLGGASPTPVRRSSPTWTPRRRAPPARLLRPGGGTGLQPDSDADPQLRLRQREPHLHPGGRRRTRDVRHRSRP